VNRLAIVASLKPGAEPRAAELLESGPPFDPAERGLERHIVYLSVSEVVFVFEGPEVEWIVGDLIDEPFSQPLFAAFDQWRSLVDGRPRIARVQYAWERQPGPTETGVERDR
jgi:hypothetical protein